MPNWWLGRPAESGRAEDENSQLEPPETPAPIFAARALKSALFGTPAPPDDTIFEIDADAEKMVGKDARKSQSGTASPTKPQGILLTPGTATARRKTVSFGNEVVDREGKTGDGKVAPKDGSASRVSKPELASRSNRKTSLTKTLESAREARVGKGTSENTRQASESKPLLDSGLNSENAGPSRKSGRISRSQGTDQQLMEELISGRDFEGDMTMDLNDPHSQSGKYWKTEYEHYHEEAKMEMLKLLQYKQLAKSYAKKKDAEAVGLTEKLKEEQRRVASMEDKVSKLSAQITTSCLEGKEDDSPELIKELARQTALAVQYRAQVEEFRAALEGNVDLAIGKGGNQFASSRIEQTLLDNQHELKKAREQLNEVKTLREEMEHIRQTLSTAEKANLKLREENTKLTQELLHSDFRLEKQIEKSDKRRNSSEGHLRRKDEAFQSLQKDYETLKEQAKSQRRDAEHLLKKRHDQVVELKKELASMKGIESSAKNIQATLERKTAEHDQIISGYLKQISELKEAFSQDRDHEIDRENAQAHGREKRDEKMNVLQHFVPSQRSSTENRDSLIPVSSQPISRPSKTMAPARHPRSEKSAGTPGLKYRSSQSALSEITNNSERLSNLGQSTPQLDKFSNLSLEGLELNLPSAERSSQLPSRIIHERRCHASPRPSMFNIASSPPKPVMIRSRDDELSRQRSNGDLNGLRQAYISSSRLSSLEGSKARGSIPPERAAAAKARLDQKNAEKKRAQAMSTGKENIRN